MILQLLFASAMVLAIVIVHLTGLASLTRVLRLHPRLLHKVWMLPPTLPIAATLGIVGIHTVEIWAYAIIYLWVGAFRGFEEALYFSTSTYAAIGYGDVLLPMKWRVFGSIEGAVGIIMFGWSTAYLVSLLRQLKLLRHDWLKLD